MNSDLKLERVIFAIDNAHDLHTIAKFLRLMDEKRAMGDLIGSVTQCIGGWDNTLEHSFMMTYIDYYKYVRHSGYVSGQESILLVPGDVRQPCVLAHPVEMTYQQTLEPMVELIGRPDSGFTYVVQTGRYFAC